MLEEAETKRPAKKGKRFRALVGLSYRSVRVEAGEICPDDLPSGSVGWLLEQKAIEPIGEDD